MCFPSFILCSNGMSNGFDLDWLLEARPSCCGDAVCGSIHIAGYDGTWNLTALRFDFPRRAYRFTFACGRQDEELSRARAAVPLLRPQRSHKCPLAVRQLSQDYGIAQYIVLVSRVAPETSIEIALAG
jgi:hypothetical protein